MSNFKIIATPIKIKQINIQLDKLTFLLKKNFPPIITKIGAICNTADALLSETETTATIKQKVEINSQLVRKKKERVLTSLLRSEVLKKDDIKKKTIDPIEPIKMSI